MAGRGVGRLALPRRRPVAQAIVGRAEVRAALEHPARDVRVGLSGRVALLGGLDPRVARGAARLRYLVGVARREEVARPLPHVAGHVVQPVAVGGEGADRRRALVAVGQEVLPGELALPRIRRHASFGRELVAPREDGALQPTARGELPLCLGRQRLSGPSRIRVRVLVRYMHHRVVVTPVERARWSFGVAPARARRVGPPGVVVVQADGTRRPAKDERAGHKQCRVDARIVGGVRRALGRGDVVGCLGEAAELGVCHRVFVRPEAVDRNAVYRALLGVKVVRAHQERAAGDPGHMLGGRPRYTCVAVRWCRRCTSAHPFFLPCSIEPSVGPLGAPSRRISVWLCRS